MSKTKGFPELQYGLELECVTLLDNAALINLLKSIDIFKGYSIAFENDPKEYTNKIILQEDCTITTIDESDERRLLKGFDNLCKNPKYSYLIDLDNTVEVTYIEIAFPPVSMDKLVQFYSAIKTFLYNPCFITVNESTGLHVNVSFKNSFNNISIDIGTIINNSCGRMFYWMMYYDRLNSNMCQLASTWLLLIYEDEIIKDKSNLIEYVRYNRRVIRSLKANKFLSIAFNNFIKPDHYSTQRIEFRVAGGPKMLSSVSGFLKYLIDIQNIMYESVSNKDCHNILI